MGRRSRLLASPVFGSRSPRPGTAYRPGLYITRLREDTGFEPHYDTAAGVADYIAWFRAGNTRPKFPGDFRKLLTLSRTQPNTVAHP